ncbi:hypothetical protein [Variovorax sp. W6]|uniref:hypothetical protein n=1 Tax=Variovorax sp. W6 TaxID=3093895 RepID=UPI003D8093F3
MTGGSSLSSPPTSALATNQGTNSKADPQSEGLGIAQADSQGGIAALQTRGADVAAVFEQTMRGGDARPYATLDTSGFGIPRTMVYDAVHGDIYASYSSTFWAVGLSAIVRFRSDGVSWSSSSLSIPGLRDIALAPDSSVLAATDASNHVHLIDLATFSVKSSHLSTFGVGDEGNVTEGSLAITKDGKLWMPTGGTTWHGLGFFDLKTLKFSEPLPSCCHGGPFLAVSRDGARLMVAPSASISPAPAMLYMDAEDGIFRTNPIGLTFFYYLTSVSDNGNRFLMGGDAVYDKAFGTVGRLPQPSTGIRAAQLSADGRRAYVLEYAVEPGSSALPIVRAFDTSMKAGTQLTLPEIGSFTLPEVPGCQSASYPDYECYRPRTRVTPDGKNLLILGSKKLVVAPIPLALRSFRPAPAM